MTATYKTRTIRVAVMPEGEPIFSETATIISIEDESAGEYVMVDQSNVTRPGFGKIAINPEEWPALRDAIDKMVMGCRK